MGCWPENKKCAVALCFDLDADTMWFGGKESTTPTQTSRGEYAVKYCVPRILNLLDKYNIKASWFIPGYVMEKYPEAVLKIAECGHEIGHHGYYHKRNTEMEIEDEKRELDMGMNAFYKVLNKKPEGYRSPAWDFSDNTLDLITEYGFKYDSNLMGDERPYFITSKKTGKSLVEIPVEWILDDAPYYMFSFGARYKTGMSDPDKVVRIWKDEFDGYYENGSCFTLTMHPQVTGRYHRMKALEELIEYMVSHEGVWFARCNDIANHWASTQK